MPTRIDAAKSVVDGILDVLVIVLSTLLLTVVSIQVVARYVFNSPLSWSEELARYLFIWLVFLAVSVAFRNNRHLRMEVLSLVFPEALRKVFAAVVFWIITSFLVLLLVQSEGILRITFGQVSPTLNVPMGFIYLSFVVSIALMLLEQVFRAIRYLTRERS